MRRILKRLALLTAALMIVAVPALADEGSMAGRNEQGQQVEKNECLLASLNCPNQVDSIQQRINRIQREISRGSDVYTNEELRKLTRELEETNRIMEEMTAGG